MDITTEVFLKRYRLWILIGAVLLSLFLSPISDETEIIGLGGILIFSLTSIISIPRLLPFYPRLVSVHLGIIVCAALTLLYLSGIQYLKRNELNHEFITIFFLIIIGNLLSAISTVFLRHIWYKVLKKTDIHASVVFNHFLAPALIFSLVLFVLIMFFISKRSETNLSDLLIVPLIAIYPWLLHIIPLFLRARKLKMSFGELLYEYEALRIYNREDFKEFKNSLPRIMLYFLWFPLGGFLLLAAIEEKKYPEIIWGLTTAGYIYFKKYKKRGK